MKKIGIGLMASGKSLRMGENKLLMEIKGKAIANHMIDKLVNLKKEESKAPKWEIEITVVSCYDQILDIATKNNLKAIKNQNAHLGQSESVKLITAELLNCHGIMFLPCDQIFIKEKSLKLLVEQFLQHQGTTPVQASYKGKKSSPVIFPKTFYKDLLTLKGDTGGKILLTDKKVILVEIEEKELIDIDTKKDIENIYTIGKGRK